MLCNMESWEKKWIRFCFTSSSRICRTWGHCFSGEICSKTWTCHSCFETGPRFGFCSLTLWITPCSRLYCWLILQCFTPYRQYFGYITAAFIVARDSNVWITNMCKCERHLTQMFNYLLNNVLCHLCPPLK